MKRLLLILFFPAVIYAQRGVTVVNPAKFPVQAKIVQPVRVIIVTPTPTPTATATSTPTPTPTP